MKAFTKKKKILSKGAELHLKSNSLKFNSKVIHFILPLSKP